MVEWCECGLFYCIYRCMLGTLCEWVKLVVLLDLIRFFVVLVVCHVGYVVVWC